MPSPFRVGFVTGATPDKWARIWRERSRVPLDLVPRTEDDQESGLRDGSLDMCLVRQPVDRSGLHCIELYDEQPVAVVGVEHVASVLDELTTADLDDEQLVRAHRSGWTPAAEQQAWPPLSEREAVEVVASGTGVVLLPKSVARLLQRKDVTSRVVRDLPPTTIGLAWLVDNEDPRVQTFIGVVRGRSERSSRG